MEKVGFGKIKKLLEIFERERHHEILLTVKNLRELGYNPSPYNLPIIPHLLPTEVVEVEHYVIADLLTLIPGVHPQRRLPRPKWLVENWLSVFYPSSRLWLERTLALPPEHLRSLLGATVPSVCPLRKKVPVLLPKHPRREGGCLNSKDLLARCGRFCPLGCSNIESPTY